MSLVFFYYIISGWIINGYNIVGVSIMKRKMGLFSKEVIIIIQTNFYMQYIFGLSERTKISVFAPNLFVAIQKTFRLVTRTVLWMLFWELILKWRIQWKDKKISEHVNEDEDY